MDTESIRLRSLRRGFHGFAEPGWCEFHTTSTIINTLRAAGWAVSFARDVICGHARLGVPADEELAQWSNRALESGASPDHVRRMAGGFTGAVGTLRGDRPGPTTALRFDIDANYGGEDSGLEHPPTRNGFVSRVRGVHHNCGHDGHIALGLVLAEAIATRRQDLAGEVRLLFQPAEEGLRGAGAMVAAGVLDDVEWLFGCHIGVQATHTGEIIAGYDNLMASHKVDVRFEGQAAHASLSPQSGRNAIVAAATAVLNLQALAQHGDGETRVNVGMITGGVSRNTVAPHAFLAIEIRGETAAILDFLQLRALQIVAGAAAMHDVSVTSEIVGASNAASSSHDAVALVGRAASRASGVTSIRKSSPFRACDDMAVMMRAVQSAGGHAAYFGLGAALRDPHHSDRFDFDEACLDIGLRVYLELLRQTGNLSPTKTFRMQI